MYHPDLEEYRKLKDQGKLVPVYREIAADGETPVSVLAKIKRGDYAFLLESAEGSQGTDGYSFIGTEPYRVLSTREGDRGNPLSFLAAELAKQRLAKVEGLPDFCGGAVGYLGYETIRRLEELPSPESDPLALPESLFMFVDNFLIFDHARNRLKIVSLASPHGDGAYEMATAKIDELADRLKQPLNQPRPTPPPHKPRKYPEFISNITRAQFEANVAKIAALGYDGVEFDA